MNDFVDGLTSYIAAVFVIIVSNVDSITMWGGLLLLVVRFIADGPKAIAQIKKWFRR